MNALVGRFLGLFDGGVDKEHLTFDYCNNQTGVAVKPIFYGAAHPSLNPQAKTEGLWPAVNGHDGVWFFDAKHPDVTPTEPKTSHWIPQ
jgi:hypothetical protein